MWGRSGCDFSAGFHRQKVSGTRHQGEQAISTGTKEEGTKKKKKTEIQDGQLYFAMAVPKRFSQWEEKAPKGILRKPYVHSPTLTDRKRLADYDPDADPPADSDSESDDEAVNLAGTEHYVEVGYEPSQKVKTSQKRLY